MFHMYMIPKPTSTLILKKQQASSPSNPISLDANMATKQKLVQTAIRTKNILDIRRCVIYPNSHNSYQPTKKNNQNIRSTISLFSVRRTFLAQVTPDWRFVTFIGSLTEER